MKRFKARQKFYQAVMLLGVFSVFMFSSCKEEEIIEDPVASFQYEISEENFLQVSFMNFSQNAETYSWNFGDGETSTEENPVHTYAEVGNYTVVLTATNSAGVSATFQELIEIKDPFEALTLLAGQTSKTWRLYRVGTSMGVGPSVDEPRIWWSLENNGLRPCVYFHEFTFNRDMEFIFDDMGAFWGEDAIFSETPVHGTCFEAVSANMFNTDGVDVSAWLSGTHSFEYNPSTNEVTLNGMGAWLGLPQLTTTGEQNTPVASKTFKISIEQHEGFDLMIVLYEYDWGVWEFSYASYSDPSLEPPVDTEPEEWGEDLEDITPNDIFVTFASRDAADFATIDTITSGSTVAFGVDDPTDVNATKVGEFTRTAGVQYQELQFEAAPDPKDIQFDNFTTVSIDIFVPSGTDFSVLVRQFVFGFADKSQTQEWWTSPVQFLVQGDDFVVGEWTTYTFDLTDVKARTDLDMIYLGIGGGGHEAGGTFYVRNLIFE